VQDVSPAEQSDEQEKTIIAPQQRAISQRQLGDVCLIPSGSFVVIEEPKLFDNELGEPVIRGSAIAPATELSRRNRVRGRESWLSEACIPVRIAGLATNTAFACY
jgi:hypothetical protein